MFPGSGLNKYIAELTGAQVLCDERGVADNDSLLHAQDRYQTSEQAAVAPCPSDKQAWCHVSLASHMVVFDPSRCEPS